VITPGDIAKFNFALTSIVGATPFFMVSMLTDEVSGDEERTFYAVTFIVSLSQGRFKLLQCRCFCGDDEMVRIVPGTRRIEDGAP